MGLQARLKTGRRAGQRRQLDGLRRLYDEAMADPDYQALAAAIAADQELQARLASDLPAQAARLRAAGWRCRQEADDGAGLWDHRRGLRVIHSLQRENENIWAHVSVSRRDRALPGWYEVRDVQWLFYPADPGIVIIAPRADHVDLSEVAHVWTCLTYPAAPDLRFKGQI